MKKVYILAIGLLILSGCASKENEQSNESPIVENSVEEQQTEGNNVVEENDTDDSKVVEGNETETIENQDDPVLSSYEEYNKIEETIDADQLTSEILTDNQNKRVILFKDQNSVEIYKSIYIKNSRHLKIIQLEGDGLLFNGTI
ncbi:MULTISPECIES: hypothetical protein [Sporosarcina]|uniref:Lipoprotein n=1 Tax=Sporosarcina contaminans TaxID=633403 RepID=A0ABW3U5N6_9BACL